MERNIDLSNMENRLSQMKTIQAEALELSKKRISITVMRLQLMDQLEF